MNNVIEIYDSEKTIIISEDSRFNLKTPAKGSLFYKGKYGGKKVFIFSPSLNVNSRWYWITDKETEVVAFCRKIEEDKDCVLLELCNKSIYKYKNYFFIFNEGKSTKVSVGILAYYELIQPDTIDVEEENLESPPREFEEKLVEIENLKF